MTGFSPDHSLKGSFMFKNVTVLASKMDEKINEAKFTMEIEVETK